ncbi:hypothetical protein LNTAR_02392 [Lentisphaera araneosa HTCC2155]|uniref:UbiA prenyltransferase family protein n=1 Tax=Lentisphaera araneosa HTCC2155 TaxID=313628 RepID=A6DP88_9BACT|nr:hypothetical protein [Lentisphaera araneosa]EDM26620.1 hypothetical protein LNTAR_02392 [Lentisphaera araneosa HTCC2155]
MSLAKFKASFLHTSQVTCIVTSLYAFLSETPQWQLFLFVYFACFFTYNIERVYQNSPEDQVNHPERWSFLRKHQGFIQKLCITSLICCLGLSFFLTKRQWLILILASIPTLLYLSPKIYFYKKRLKELFLAKEFSIAFSWALITAVLPFLQFNALFFISCFILALINVIFCDDLDKLGDSKQKIKTIANTSQKNTPIAIGLCILLSVTFFFINMKGFSLAYIHLLIAQYFRANSTQYDLALIWPIIAPF